MTRSDTLRDKSRTPAAKAKSRSRRMERRLRMARAIFAAQSFPALHAL